MTGIGDVNIVGLGEMGQRLRYCYFGTGISGCLVNVTD